jgi:hypothetical protein
MTLFMLRVGAGVAGAALAAGVVAVEVMPVSFVT